MDHPVEAPPWRYVAAGKPAKPLDGPWSVHFVEGGPELPADYRPAQLESWTREHDPNAERFAGTARYTTEFDRPPAPGRGCSTSVL